MAGLSGESSKRWTLFRLDGCSMVADQRWTPCIWVCKRNADLSVRADGDHSMLCTSCISFRSSQRRPLPPTSLDTKALSPPTPFPPLSTSRAMSLVSLHFCLSSGVVADQDVGVSVLMLQHIFLLACIQATCTRDALLKVGETLQKTTPTADRPCEMMLEFQGKHTHAFICEVLKDCSKAQ